MSIDTPTTAAPRLDLAFINVDCDPDLVRPAPRPRRATPPWVFSLSVALVCAAAVGVAGRRGA